MTFASYAVTDSFTMLRRNLRRMRRYPMVFYIAGIPLVLLLLFVYVLESLGLAIAGGQRLDPARQQVLVRREPGRTTSRTSCPGSC